MLFINAPLLHPCGVVNIFINQEYLVEFSFIERKLENVNVVDLLRISENKITDVSLYLVEVDSYYFFSNSIIGESLNDRLPSNSS
jgi:hypothetical protein